MLKKSRVIMQIILHSLAVLLVCSGLAANAATITVLLPSSPSSGPRLTMAASLTYLRLTGEIEEGDSERLRAILTRLRRDSPPTPGRPLATIELSSSGGDVYEGLNIGYLLREFDVASLVRKGDLCLSSCALAFLGGTASHLPHNSLPDRRIEVGGEVGFHNFFINPKSAKLPAAADPVAGMVVGFNLARGGSALLVRYASVMSLDPAFVGLLLGRPPEVWDYIDRNSKFVDLTSCPLTVDRPAESDARLATNICNHATGGFSPVGISNARPLSARDARRWLLGFVQKSAASVTLKGPLVTQLGATLASRDDRLVEALYGDLRNAGVRLPELVGPTFEVSGYVSGSYEMQCYVSFSATDPDRYDVAIGGPAGLSAAYRAAPDKCRRLFLFDRATMLNPSK